MKIWSHFEIALIIGLIEPIGPKKTIDLDLLN